jgi:uncharacterized membrane protein YfcA
MQEVGLFLLAIFAGWVDAVAGGGGLLVIPGLLMSGFSPLQAIATNKFQAVFGAASAGFHFIRTGVVTVQTLLLPIVTVFLGSVLGAVLVSSIDASWLEKLIPILLIIIAVYLMCSSNTKLDAATSAKITEKQYNVTAAPAVGFYDGFFGPGTGTFFTLSGRWGLGLSLLDATARSKILNTISNFAALIFFLTMGIINWRVGVIMAIGQIIGATLGAKMAHKIGAKLIRPLLISLCLVLSFKLLFWS